jgi:predicted transcriptional regulator
VAILKIAYITSIGGMMINTIEDFCKKHDVTLFGLSTRTGIPSNTVYRLRARPQTIPSADVLNRIFKAFPDAKLDELIKYVPDEGCEDVNN